MRMDLSTARRRVVLPVPPTRVGYRYTHPLVPGVIVSTRWFDGVARRTYAEPGIDDTVHLVSAVDGRLGIGYEQRRKPQLILGVERFDPFARWLAPVIDHLERGDGTRASWSGPDTTASSMRRTIRSGINHGVEHRRIVLRTNPHVVTMSSTPGVARALCADLIVLAAIVGVRPTIEDDDVDALSTCDPAEIGVVFPDALVRHAASSRGIPLSQSLHRVRPIVTPEVMSDP